MEGIASMKNIEQAMQRIEAGRDRIEAITQADPADTMRDLKLSFLRASPTGGELVENYMSLVKTGVIRMRGAPDSDCLFCQNGQHHVPHTEQHMRDGVYSTSMIRQAQHHDDDDPLASERTAMRALRVYLKWALYEEITSATGKET